MDFWRSVQQAAEKAAEKAKDLGKKGLVSGWRGARVAAVLARGTYMYPRREAADLGQQPPGVSAPPAAQRAASCPLTQPASAAV